MPLCSLCIRSGGGYSISTLWLFSKDAFHCTHFGKKNMQKERNYDTCNLQLLTIKLPLQEWHHHKNIEDLKSAKCLMSSQARWVLFFSCFKLTTSWPGNFPFLEWKSILQLTFCQPKNQYGRHNTPWIVLYN